MDVKFPWEKSGEEGWDNYGNFQLWLTEKLGPEHEEWVNESPTQLMTVMYNLGFEIAENN